MFAVHRFRVALGVFLFLLPAVQSARAQDQVPCAEALTAAEDLYFDADFEQAIVLLERCLGEGTFTDVQRNQAYVQLAKAFWSNQQVGEARTRLNTLFDLNPGYQPDPAEDPLFIALVEEVRSQRPPPDPTPTTDPADPDPADPDPAVPAPLAVEAAAQQGSNVSNVAVRREGDRLVVTYDLVGDAKKYAVTLGLATETGGPFSSLPRALSGDVGKGVRPGAARRIVWTALEDFPDGLDGAPYALRVSAEPQSGGNRMLYLLGGGLAAGAVTTVVLLSGSSEDPPIDPPAGGLPAPPALPIGN